MKLEVGKLYKPRFNKYGCLCAARVSGDGTQWRRVRPGKILMCIDDQPGNGKHLIGDDVYFIDTFRTNTAGAHVDLEHCIQRAEPV